MVRLAVCGGSGLGMALKKWPTAFKQWLTDTRIQG